MVTVTPDTPSWQNQTCTMLPGLPFLSGAVKAVSDSALLYRYTLALDWPTTITASSGYVDDQLMARLLFAGIVAVPPPDDGITVVLAFTLAVIFTPYDKAGVTPLQPALLLTCVGVTDAAVVTGTVPSSIAKLDPRNDTAIVALTTRLKMDIGLLPHTRWIF